MGGVRDEFGFDPIEMAEFGDVDEGEKVFASRAIGLPRVQRGQMTEQIIGGFGPLIYVDDGRAIRRSGLKCSTGYRC